MTIKSLAVCAAMAFLFLNVAQATTEPGGTATTPAPSATPPRANVAELYRITEKVRAADRAACLKDKARSHDCSVQPISCSFLDAVTRRPVGAGFVGLFASNGFLLIVDTPDVEMTYTDKGRDGVMDAFNPGVKADPTLDQATDAARMKAMLDAFEEDRVGGSLTARRIYAEATDKFIACIKADPKFS